MRRQGLFFLLSAAAIAIMFAVPIASWGAVKLFPFGFKVAGVYQATFWSLGILTVASGIVPLVLAFLPSRRDVQLRFGAAVGALQLGLVGFVIYYVVKVMGLPGGAVGFSAIMPLIAVILNIFAIRAVIADMKTIKKASRIR